MHVETAFDGPFCFACGTRLPKGAVYCIACGERQIEPGPERTDDTTQVTMNASAPASVTDVDPAPPRPPHAWPTQPTSRTPDKKPWTWGDTATEFATTPPRTTGRPYAHVRAHEPVARQPEITRVPGIAAIVAAALICLGSMAPWATVSVALSGTIDIAGSDRDGQLTLILGIVVAVLLAIDLVVPRGVFSGLAGIASLFIAGTGIVDWRNVGDVLKDVRGEPMVLSAGVGWGLVLVTVAGVLAAVLSFVQAVISSAE